MYEPNCYPNSVICPVDVIFNPSPADTKQHQVWIWFHVAAQQAVWTAISEVFQGKKEHTTIMWFVVVGWLLRLSLVLDLWLSLCGKRFYGEQFVNSL